MTENKRFTIKPQDDLFGVVDNYSPDKICVVNGIRTEIEAKWLCNVMNDLNDENEQLKFENANLKVAIDARDAKIEVCEKKFRELGFIITVDDGYVIE